MNVYKCLTQDFGKLQTKINRIIKKLDKNGKKWKFEVVSNYPEKVTVYDYAGSEYVPQWQFRPKVSTIVLEVTSYIFDIEPLKIGNYQVIAVLEHKQEMNLVHVIDDSINKDDVTAQYLHTASSCVHCNHKRQRNKTVILQDENGNRLQVGTTCLHEYTGIDCLDVLKGYTEVDSLLINDVSINHSDRGSYSAGRYERTVDYLASCLKLIDKDGYIKDVTKYKGWSEMHYVGLDTWFEPAQQIIDYFKANDFTDNFMSNIKAVLIEEYTKQSGFVAYAPIAYQKALEASRERDRVQEERDNSISEYVGNIGDKLNDLELILDAEFGYETAYGYTNIYIFKDSKGNVYKWSTGKALWKDDRYVSAYEIGDSIKLKGSIKDHEEYKGLKQTVLTRCKII